MSAVVVSATYDPGTLSAPAFLALEIQDEAGETTSVLLRGKRATRQKHLKVGDPFTT